MINQDFHIILDIIVSASVVELAKYFLIKLVTKIDSKRQTIFDTDGNL